ncbi:MAG: hypothetical protein HKN88_06855 [Gammaproteobacteria bacterium]|nr:hypothetical protein [Gammaproteobacteria bacterium]NNC97777.1 hypothetical protein [Gammaproteobacteria bacterium]NNM14144.1 hypothetical protein [Gammaproteobacteria bacterium]
MGVFDMVALIVFMGVICEMYRIYSKNKRSKGSSSEWLGKFQDSENRQQQKIRALEERIKVLERIVTDKNYDLKKQFDELDAA